MDMNKAFVLRKEDVDPQWHVIDATNRVLGRLATEIATILRGKDRAFFTPHTDSGDYLVIINCEKIKLTGNKWEQKIYERYSGYRSGLNKTTAKQMRDKKPEEIIHLAVWGMMPKNRLSKELVTKLKVYAGPEHPHIAQITTTEQRLAKPSIQKHLTGKTVAPKVLSSKTVVSRKK